MKDTKIINDLLNQAAEMNGGLSDYKLAQLLDLSKQKISGLRSGKEHANVYVCTRIALATQKDPLEIVAQVEMESAKSETQREFWRSFKFSGMRNSIGLLLCGTSVFLGGAWPGGNAEAGIMTNSHNVYYVK